MAQKKAFILRIDPQTMKAIEKWASDEFRSTNGHVEWLLHRALRDAGRVKKGQEKPPEDTKEN